MLQDNIFLRSQGDRRLARNRDALSDFDANAKLVNFASRWIDRSTLLRSVGEDRRLGVWLLRKRLRRHCFQSGVNVRRA